MIPKFIQILQKNLRKEYLLEWDNRYEIITILDAKTKRFKKELALDEFGYLVDRACAPMKHTCSMTELSINKLDHSLNNTLWLKLKEYLVLSKDLDNLAREIKRLLTIELIIIQSEYWDSNLKVITNVNDGEACNLIVNTKQFKKIFTYEGHEGTVYTFISKK